ncbi:bifunctional Chromo-like domain superfamily/Chromo-chromo shadow domain/Chromo domain/Chromo domain subgroup/Chromo domain [Babesia duncani]|uniref:Bifunctional Chromo-like domain superfamily/Chromo-chromo shadow domain/Chromo domain/Chromo domain subgroup/Chromo domain n=1 Tax=Babesia duncani TaxID=323732 RepID=A0AAD9UQA5_9APIC|nr:bifunctional Chromo-like domain superfamily/Chromo-chromo shadow domain/Chromo domain/Chromo domain subgroup/Chromo domain [Babesia duncani]
MKYSKDPSIETPIRMPMKKLSSLEIDGEPEEDEYEVEDIIDFKYIKGQPKFLVKWKGFPEEDNTWEPEDNMTNLPAFVEKMAILKAAKSEKPKTTKGEKPATNGPKGARTNPLKRLKLPDSEGSGSPEFGDDRSLERRLRDFTAERRNSRPEPEQLPPEPDSSMASHGSHGLHGQPKEEEDAVEVEDLLDYKPRNRKDYFLVRWKGDWEDSWEPRSNLLIVGDLMHKMNDLKTSYMRIYGPSEMEEDVFVTVQSIRISGAAIISAVVNEMTRWVYYTALTILEIPRVEV